MKRAIIITLVSALLITTFGYTALTKSDAEVRAEAERDGRTQGSADVNMFGCGMGGFFLGPFGWLHAQFAQRQLDTERLLTLQDKPELYKAFYTPAYKQAKKNQCFMYSLGGSVIWVLFLFY